MDLNGISKLTETYAAKRRLLTEAVDGLEAELAAVRKKHIGQIKRYVAVTAEAQDVLRAAIEENPAVFSKPKSRIIDGVKIGFRKMKGEIIIANTARTLERLKEMFGVCADTYIKTEEKPIKNALATLSGADLKKLGVRIEDDMEEVVISPVDSEVDKLVDALLKSAEETEAV